MKLIIQENYDDMSVYVANYIAEKINSYKPLNRRPFTLGLPTGSSPIGTYAALVKLNRTGKVSFANVKTFNMDEYVGLAPEHPESYHYFMHKNFFDHIDIQKENINILDGVAQNLDTECDNYEEKIKSAGGIDLFLAGIGHNGHIAFNEPLSSLNSCTRVKTLTEDTREANSRFFDNDIQKVPLLALTVGIKTIMAAGEVVVIASGKLKAPAVRLTIEGGVSPMCPASKLHEHRHFTMVCDKAATNELSQKTMDYCKIISHDNQR
ncbi:MAG: glucosamine-6-phosphate deaminase [Alphaproteobacteria bacterium]|nr:glucosamine-6-phosphate deaminase [Alphaproteobacteria bacterium]